MNRARQRRLALRRHRWRARFARLTLPRGCWAGFPSDVREAYGHHPDYPSLRGWIFQAWRYHPSKLNTPWWWTPFYVEHHGVRPGHWVLRRTGDAGLYAVLSPEHFERWQSYDPRASVADAR